MIGIVTLLLGALGFVVTETKSGIESAKNWKEASAKRKDTYYDGKNHLVYMPKGRRVIQTQNRYREWVLEDIATGQVYRNYTRERVERDRAQSLKEAKSVGDTFYRISLTEEEKEYGRKHYLIEYKDFMCPFYKEISSGRIAALTIRNLQRTDENGNFVYKERPLISKDEDGNLIFSTYKDIDYKRYYGISVLVDPETGEILCAFDLKDRHNEEILRDIIAANKKQGF